jgi:uncharacterized protein
MSDQRTSSPFHEGEIAVQRRAGVEGTAAVVGRNVQRVVPDQFAEFLAAQPFVVIGGRDQHERVWASLIVGGVGFAQATDPGRVVFRATPPPGDPLEESFAAPGSQMGVLALEAHSRGRIRLNGVATRVDDGIALTIAEVFGNCPKYIQRRIPVEALEPLAAAAHGATTALDDEQAASIGAADTFFIASAHPRRGADASHRGGTPGFVEVAPGGRRLRFPDYQGNRMFQTLGNLAIDPRAGLLFVDWETGSTLQLTGKARILWDEDAISRHPGAERVVDFAIAEVREHGRAMPARWRLIEASRHNPPVTPAA